MNRPFRYWYYFRMGYGVYFSLLIGLMSNVVVLYKLALNEIPFGQSLFPHLWIFGVVGLLLVVPISSMIGWLHLRKSRAYSTESSIGTLMSPYNYLAVPGKEKDLGIPFTIFSIHITRAMLEKFELMTPERSKMLDGFEDAYRRLASGERL